MAAPHIFTRQEIVTLLRGDPRAVERGILALYERQLEDERSASTARARNRSGFSIATAPDGTRLAQQLLAGQRLAGRDLSRAFEIASYHAGQLARIATELDAVRTKAREEERKQMYRRLYDDLVRDVERVLGRPVKRPKFNEVVVQRARRNGDTSPEGMIGAGQEILEELQDKHRR
jgi:hypothetical protein